MMGGIGLLHLTQVYQSDSLLILKMYTADA